MPCLSRNDFLIKKSAFVACEFWIVGNNTEKGPG